MADFSTLKEHHEYLDSTVKLKLWFLWNWLRTNPAEDFSTVLRKRVDIYRKTHLNTDGLCPPEKFDDPEWLKMESAAHKIYEAHRQDKDASGFERNAFEVFRDSISVRAPLSYRMLVLREDLKDYQCGCLRFDAPAQASPDRVFFHIANSVRPKSIFEDPDYIPSCLRQLMDRCEKEFKINIITTGTWLNSLPKWVAYFPQSWQRNLADEEKDVQWHYGYWGQFISSRYTLNQKYADILRKTGKMPYYPRSSWCTLSELRQHLDGMAAKQAELGGTQDKIRKVG